MENSNKPTHRVVRYYGSGDNARSAEIGAVWTKDDGKLAICLNTMTQQVWLHAFPINQQGK